MPLGGTRVGSLSVCGAQSRVSVGAARSGGPSARHRGVFLARPLIISRTSSTASSGLGSSSTLSISAVGPPAAGNLSAIPPQGSRPLPFWGTCVADALNLARSLPRARCETLHLPGVASSDAICRPFGANAAVRWGRCCR